jgi:hypothetical protein
MLVCLNDGVLRRWLLRVTWPMLVILDAACLLVVRVIMDVLALLTSRI